MDIRWNLIHELNQMETVPDERTELTQLRKLKARLHWSLPAVVLAVVLVTAGGESGASLMGLLWLLLLAVCAVQDRQDLRDGSFLLADEKPSPARGLLRMLQGGLNAGMALTGLFSTFAPALPGCLVLGCCGYWVYLALVQTAAMKRLAEVDPEGVWLPRRSGTALAALLGAALVGVGLLALARPLPFWYRAELPDALTSYTALSQPDEPGVYRVVQSEHDGFELYIAQTPTEPGCDRLAVTVENGAVTAAVLMQEEWRDRSVTTEYLWREGAWQLLNTGLTPTERELVCLRAQTNWRPPFARQSRILGYERLVPESPFGAQAARITWRDAQTVFGAPYVVCYELDADGALVAARDESPNDNLGSWQLLLRGEEAAEVFAALSAQPFAPAV